MKRARDHALLLLRKANNDLIAAQATLRTGQALDTVCFHAQQAAEKSLKAILALYVVEYPWRHDMSELLALARPRVPEVEPFEGPILRMTPYAVTVRYDEEFEPTLDEATEALEIAQRFHQLSSAVVQRGTV